MGAFQVDVKLFLAESQSTLGIFLKSGQLASCLIGWPAKVFRITSFSNYALLCNDNFRQHASFFATSPLS